MKKLCFIFTILILIYPFAGAYAQQTSFQVTIPPIPWYEFSKGQKDLKVNGTFINLSGAIESAEAGGDVNIYGGGASSFYRYAFRDKFAFDIGGLPLGAGGDVGDSATMDLEILALPFDIEFQPVKTDHYSVILFGGFNFIWMYLGVNYDDGTDVYAVDIWSSMRGPQGGMPMPV